MAFQLDPVGPDDRAGGVFAAPEEEGDGIFPFRRSLLTTALTLVVMAAFAGGLWFAYQEGRHAGSGDGADVPLIRADTRPMKIKPDNPGGMAVPDRDKLIYSEAKPSVERLLPPPEKPLPKPTAPPPAAAVPPPAPPLQAGAPLPPPPAAPAAKPAAPLPPPPANAAAAAKAPSPAPLATKPGGVRIQLASLRSEDQAREEWDRLKRKYPELLGKLAETTHRADLGTAGIYYRITAGPLADKAAAEHLCGALHQRSVGCVIAK